MATFGRRRYVNLLLWVFGTVSVLYVGYKSTMYMISVDGGYTEWTQYSECTAKCAGGTKTRTRFCTNPSQQFAGQNCSRLGEAIETVDCNTELCPVHGKYGQWGEYGACSVECGGGTQTHERKCDSPAPQHGGRDCRTQGETTETRKCNEQACKVDGKYGGWGEFSTCSVQCGGGTQSRERKCDSPAPQNGGKDCSDQGKSKESKKCNEKPCTVNGGYSDWSEWSICSVTCGIGTMTRTRVCNNPFPEHGGKSCINQHLGEAEDTNQCTLKAC